MKAVSGAARCVITVAGEPEQVLTAEGALEAREGAEDVAPGARAGADVDGAPGTVDPADEAGLRVGVEFEPQRRDGERG